MTSKIYVNETALVNDVKASLLKKYGGFVLKIHGGMFQRTGIPDILYWLEGHSYAFECKTGNNGYEATMLQKIKLKQLYDEGVHVAVITQVDQAIKIIEEVMGK